MSHMTAPAGATPQFVDHHGHPFDLSNENITLPRGAAARWSLPLIVLGVIGIIATLGMGLASKDLTKHALASIHIGVLGVLAASLGAMFFVMAFHLTMAGWSVTIRRQFENVATLAPWAGFAVLLLILYEIMSEQPHLFIWMTKAVQKEDVLYQEKSGFLNPFFFVVRSVIYVLVWAFLSWRLRSYSTQQDRTGDRWLSNKARFTSSWGMLAFALSTAFAGFDWIMSLDYRFFSTMWGVYFFAGAAYVSVPVMVLLLSWIQGQGRMKGLVTEEHYHDLGKFMFGFTVFWAYIGFSQYFLIWYANIPEETFFMLARKLEPWRGWTIFLVVGHFVVPFFLLLWRGMRRVNGLIGAMAVWMILMETVDMIWIVRPLVYANTTGADHPWQNWWLDVLGIGGAWLLFFGLAIRRVGSGQLVPTRDPRLVEALNHRNYV